MANQKQVQKRHYVIDHCLRDYEREYTLEDILGIVNKAMVDLGQHAISERQLYNDITFFQSEEGYGAEIDTRRVVRLDEKGRNRSYVVYRYRDPNFSIKSTRLPELQLRFFRAVVGSLIDFSNAPMQEWLTNHYSKLQDFFDGMPLDTCLMMDTNPFVGGRRAKEWVTNFETIFTSIINKRALDMTLDTSAYGVMKVCLHPFFLRQYNSRWYVLGVMSHRPNKIVPVAIDLLQKVTPSKEHFIEYPFNPNEYFEDLVGVSDPLTPPIDVHLRFHGWVAKHLEFNPLHGSQRSHWEEVNGEQVLDVHLNVKHNLELENLLMGFVGTMEVLGPEQLVKKYKEHILWACKTSGIAVTA